MVLGRLAFGSALSRGLVLQLESFHNLLAALAPKRLFLGRGTVYRIQVAIAVLKWNYGPAWVLLALEELGIEIPGATVLRRTSKRIEDELRGHKERKSAEHKKKVLMRKRIETEAGWVFGTMWSPCCTGRGLLECYEMSKLAR